MKKIAGAFLYLLVGIVVVAILIWAVYGLSVVFSPRFVALDRVVTEQSKSFIDSQVSAINDMIIDYYAASTTPGQKSAIHASVCQKANALSIEVLPVNIRQFISETGGC